MAFDNKLKKKLLLSLKRDISILRQVLYKEIMANKRCAIDNGDTTVKLTLDLTDSEKQAIDSNIEWFMADDVETIDDKLVEKRAKIVLEELKNTGYKTSAQDNYEKELENALTLTKDEKIN